MKTYPIYPGLPRTRCHAQSEPHNDCVEWSAYYDSRHGVLCACALPKAHASQHLCVCGYHWGAGEAPTLTLPDAEMLVCIDQILTQKRWCSNDL